MHAPKPDWTRLAIGAIAGIVATAPMTTAMRCLHRRLPGDEQYPLPPRELVERSSLKRMGRREDMTVIAHFLYGAATGALFALLRRRPGPFWGAFYGVGIWAASYLGWIPSIGLLQSAQKHPQRRNMLMIGVHVIWGAALAEAFDDIERSKRAAFADGPAADSPAPDG